MTIAFSSASDEIKVKEPINLPMMMDTYYTMIHDVPFSRVIG